MVSFRKNSFNPWPGYAKQKQFAMDLCQHQWVLNLDADEEVSTALAKKISVIIKEDKCSSVRCLRNDIFMENTLSSWSKKPNSELPSDATSRRSLGF